MKISLIAALLSSGIAMSCDFVHSNSGVRVFVENRPNYNMNIEAAGIAKIPAAHFTKGDSVKIDYSYTSGSEKRNGSMTLSKNKKERFEGTWKTIADVGTVYSGAIFLVFSENGEAIGRYKYAGSSYNISINRIQ